MYAAAKSLQLCPTLHDPMDSSLPGSSIHGIFQARVLKYIYIYTYIYIYIWEGIQMKWIRKWQPTPVSLPGESHGHRSLAGCSPWGHGESDMTEVTEHARAQIKKQNYYK